MSRGRKGVNDNFLEPLFGKLKRKPFATVDIESKDGDTQAAGFTHPFLIGVYDAQRREYVEFRDEPHLASRSWKTRYYDPGGCVDKTLSYLLSPQFRGYNIYAHNGGSFDHLFWLAWLRKHMDEYMFEVVPVQSSIQKIEVWRLPEDPDDPIRDRWTFLDSMKLLPMGLERACQTFGLPGKVNHDLNMHEDDPRWSVYLKQDCIALAEVLNLTHDLVENKLGGEVGMTAPSTSMKLFRRRFLGRDGTPSRIARFAHWPDCKQKATCAGCSHEWVRRGYYGGRTEMFKAYGEKLHYYDINSSYVAAMHEDMPVGDRHVTDKLDWKMADKHAGFVECSVDIPPDCKLPPLPHRSKETGKLMFPTGKFTGVWSTEELALLDDPYVQGRITNVKRVVWFRKKPVFKNMVETLWSLRDKTREDYDEGLSAMAKLMGNSLYGKFGMKVERTSVVFSHIPEEETCFLCKEPVPAGGGLCDNCEGSKPAMKEPDGDVWYQRKVVDAPYIIPHIAAHITALARVRIWRFMKAAMEAGGEVFYCDSVTGDRTTVVRSQEKGIEVLTFEELWSRAQATASNRGKESANLVGYEALTEAGWNTIEKVIRHRSGKVTHRITTKHGQTQVTLDHGIMVDGVETSPESFVESEASFTKVRVPPAIPLERIDLLDYVRDWSLTRELQKPARTETLRFEVDGDHLVLPSRWHDAREGCPLRIRRFYERGSEELHALVRLVATYVGDGSASIPGVTTTTRFMLSFCKQHRSVVERVAADLLTIAPDANLTGPLWTDTVFVVRSGTISLACLFAALAGVKSRGKRFPSFFYALDEEAFGHAVDAFAEADAPRDAAGQMVMTTNSQRLAAGFSYLLAQHEVEHGFTFRESKRAWTIRTRPTGTERNRYSIKDEVFEGREDEWVYDLSVTGTHTFVDGIGQVLLHNTDSVITTAKLPSSPALGALKDEYPGKELKGTFVQPKVYMLESEAFDAPKVTMKGFPKKLRTKENLIKLQAGEVLSYPNLERVRTLAKVGFHRGPQMRNVKKSFKSTYDKRILHEDGSTSPVVLDESEFGDE